MVWVYAIISVVLVCLIGLISLNSGKIELKAAACDDKIKAIHLKELKFSVESIRLLTQKEYKKGKSYFISKNEPTLKPLKEIYYRTHNQTSNDANYWPWWAMLHVPIRGIDESKIMGFLMVDDPADYLIPSMETIHTLEILATQVSVAIENRKSYMQFKEGSLNLNSDLSENPSSIKKIVDKIFKQSL